MGCAFNHRDRGTVRGSGRYGLPATLRAGPWTASLAVVVLGCGMPSGSKGPAVGSEPRSPSSRSQQIRPTEGDGWQGNAYRADVGIESYASSGGHFKVWYAERGPSAVPLRDDDPSDGVPDYPQTVAKRLEETRRVLVDETGFWPPLDDSVYHDGEDFGGDARFDVYLKDLEQSDGYRVVEGCVPGPARCAGYFVMENDFEGFSYPSTEEAIEVVASHEYMHAVLDAYTTRFPRFLTEGFATWAEERVFPGQRDYERLVRAFFRQTDRPLSSSDPGTFTDAFPYGAAMWPTYLHQRYGDSFLHELLLETSTSFTDDERDIWDAKDDLLRDYGSTFPEAFTRFALWNLLTGERAGLLPGAGYRDAERLPEARVEQVSRDSSGGPGETIRVTAKHLSAKYRVLESSGISASRVEIVATERLQFAVFAVGPSRTAGPVFLRPAGALDRAEMSIPASGELYVAAVHTETEEGEGRGRLEIRPADGSGETAGGDAGDAWSRDVDAAPPGDAGDVGAARTGRSRGGGEKSRCSTANPARPLGWSAAILIAIAASRFRRTPCVAS